MLPGSMPCEMVVVRLGSKQNTENIGASLDKSGSWKLPRTRFVAMLQSAPTPPWHAFYLTVRMWHKDHRRKHFILRFS